MKAVEKWKSGAIYECTRNGAAIELIASLRCGLKECSICDRRIAHKDNACWEF